MTCLPCARRAFRGEAPKPCADCVSLNIHPRLVARERIARAVGAEVDLARAEAERDKRRLLDLPIREPRRS